MWWPPPSPFLRGPSSHEDEWQEAQPEQGAMAQAQKEQDDQYLQHNKEGLQSWSEALFMPVPGSEYSSRNKKATTAWDIAGSNLTSKYQ